MWRRTKEGGIHSWENGDLDEDGVSFLSLSLKNTTLLFGLSAPVLYMYFVEDGLRNSNKLTERFELKIKQ